MASNKGLLTKSKDITNTTYSKVKGRFSRKRIIILTIVFLVLFFVIRNATKPKFEVDLEVVKKEQFTESIIASGEVVADEAIELNFETAGTVAEIGVKLGDAVKKGDLIARLDTTNLYSAYLSAEADLRAKQATLDSVYDGLQGKKTTETYAEIDTRTTAETNRDKSYRAFVIAQRNLAGATLKAPFDGIVASVPEGLSVGTNVALPSSYQFSVVNPETIYFLAEASEIDIPKLTSNQKVKITLDAYPNEVFEGKVEGMGFKSITTSTGGRAFQVRTTLPAQDSLKFRVGMSGDAEFIVSEKPSQLVVPQIAVVEKDGKSFVWVVERRRVKKAKIETRASSIDDVEVLSGVDEGETVIIRPPSDLEEGDRVKVTNN